MEKRSDTNNKTSTQSNARKYHLVFAFFLPLFAEPLFLLLLIRTHSLSPLRYIYFETDFPCYFRSFYILRSCSTSIHVFFIHSFIQCYFFRSLSLLNAVLRFSHFFSAANAPLCACSLDAEHQTVQFSRRHNSLLTPFLLQHEFSRLPLNSGLECSCVPCA